MLHVRGYPPHQPTRSGTGVTTSRRRLVSSSSHTHHPEYIRFYFCKGGQKSVDMTNTTTNDNNIHVPRRVVVVGLGAMGGGMAHVLLESKGTSTVIGYDINQPALEDFFQVAKDAGKVGTVESPPQSMKDAILDQDVDIVLLSLVNESQCETVSFGGGKETNRDDERSGGNLLQLMRKGSCVILTSTVTGT
jgi:threonine dehydrogenase-like Zn-dependent dehydrogenase